MTTTENNSLFTEVTVEETATVSGGQASTLYYDNNGATLLLVQLTPQFILYGATPSVTSSDGDLVAEGNRRGLSTEKVLSIITELQLFAKE